MRKFGILIIVFIMPAPVMAHAGAWPMPRGQGQVISTNLYDRATKSYNANGRLDSRVDFSKLEAGLFIEHGISDKTTFVLDASWQDIGYIEEGDLDEEIDFSGIGQSYIGLRRLLLSRDNMVLSAQGGILFAGGGEVISDADLGLGITNFEARLLFGRSFKLFERGGFVDLQIARRFRPGKYPSEWRLEASGGIDIGEKSKFMLQGFYSEAEEILPLARANYRLKLQPSIVYKRTDKTSWQFGGFQTIAGKNIIREQAVFIGIWTRY